METGVWGGVGPPEAVRGERSPRTGSWPTIVLRPGSEVVLVYRLLSGQYRVRLLPSSSSGQTIVEAFTLAAAPEPVVEEESEPPAEAPEVQDEATRDIEAVPDLPVPSHVTVELRGIATAEGREPRFTFVVRLPDGTTRQRDVTLTGALHDTWTLAEYNPENQTVTLASGNRILILHRGEPTALPVSPREAGGQPPLAE